MELADRAEELVIERRGGEIGPGGRRWPGGTDRVHRAPVPGQLLFGRPVPAQLADRGARHAFPGSPAPVRLRCRKLALRPGRPGADLRRGGPRANLKLTKIEREIAVATCEKAIQSAFAEVGDALTRRATLLEQREAWDRLPASLEATLRLSEARYQAGLDGYLDVLVAQRSLRAAQQTGVALHLADKANRIALYKALGGGS